MKGADALAWAKVGGLAVAGFVVVAAGLKIADKLKAGGKALDAAKEAAKEVVTKDLNPASTENVVYRAANAVTGGSFSAGPKSSDEKPLGVRLWEWMNPDKVARENANAATVSVQGAAMQQAQENFRESEIAMQNAAAAEAAATEEQMSKARSDFRLSEIIGQTYPEVYSPAIFYRK